jgi:hypothetical protein
VARKQGLPGRHSRQRTTFPRRLQEREDPMETEKSAEAPAPTMVPDTPERRRVYSVARDSRTAADGDTPCSTMTLRPTGPRPKGQAPSAEPPATR